MKTSDGLSVWALHGGLPTQSSVMFCINVFAKPAGFMALLSAAMEGKYPFPGLCLSVASHVTESIPNPNISSCNFNFAYLDIFLYGQ